MNLTSRKSLCAYAFVCLVGFVICPLPVTAEPVAHCQSTQTITGRAKKAGGFVLADQYGNRHTYLFPKEKVTVLLFADYKGHAQLEPWIRPLYDRYGDDIIIDGVADVSAVPGFLRSIVRNAFRKQLNYPVMLDWRGTVTDRYAYQKGLANLLLIDRQGVIKLRLKGAASESKLHTLGRHIDELVQQKSPRTPPCDSVSTVESNE